MPCFSPAVVRSQFAVIKAFIRPCGLYDPDKPTVYLDNGGLPPDAVRLTANAVFEQTWC